jgi:hypothetical protein
MFADDRSLAVLAFGRIKLMPVEMAKVTKSRIAIIFRCLAFNLWDRFSSSATFNSIKTLVTHHRRLLENFECFKPSSTCKTDEAFRVVFFCGASKSYYTSLDWKLALMASSGCSFTGW